MNALEVEKVKTSFAQAIRADASGQLPSQIELLKVGTWRTAWHGDFMITSEDLDEYVVNFNNAVGLPDKGSAGAPIDFGHKSGEEAAGWIKAVSTDGETLFGEVKWSKAGKDAILNDEYKFFSPEFFPKGRGGWMDAENYELIVDNVIIGGGLTNIPLFKTLGAIMASANGRREIRINEETINASEIKEKENTMPTTLEDVRGKKAADLDDAEKAFVAENKEKFTAEEQTNLGLEVTAAPVETPAAVAPVETKKEEETPVVEPELAAVAASIKSGESVAIKASELKELKDTRDEYRKEKATAIVASHIARGAVKADAKDKWVERLVAASGTARTEMEEMLADIPTNPVVAAAAGGDVNASDQISAVDELRTKAAEAVKASREAGKEIAIGDAFSQVRKAEPELAKRYDTEIQEGSK